MARTVDQIRREALEIVRDDYPKVKRGIYRLEVFMRTRSRKAVYELRDFLDHLAALFRDDITLEEAEKHIHECRTHLRRCAVEPLEYMAEKRFVQLDRYARWFGRVPVVLRDNPLSKPEFFQKMREAKECIAQGRIVKTAGAACEWMEKAFEIETDLLAQIHPLGYLVQGFWWLLCAFLAGAVCSWVAF